MLKLYCDLDMDAALFGEWLSEMEVRNRAIFKQTEVGTIVENMQAW